MDYFPDVLEVGFSKCVKMAYADDSDVLGQDGAIAQTQITKFVLNLATWSFDQTS